MKTVAVVLAAGSGSRMKTKVKKQYLKVNGKPLIYYALNVFEYSFIDEVVLVVSPGDVDFVQRDIVDKFGFKKVTAIVEGGKQRYHSVCIGLNAASADADYAFIHDGARPFVNMAMLNRLLDAVKSHRACVAAMPVKDTIKIADENGFSSQTPNRDRVWMIQTPQVFDYSLIRELYNKLIDEEDEILSKGINITDDAMVVETFSDVKVKLVEGSYSNIKITTPEDIPAALAIMGE